MKQLVCFSHPKYDGITPPNLSCKTCCDYYVANVVKKQKAIREEKKFNTNKWLEEKARRKPEVYQNPPKADGKLLLIASI